MRPMPRRDGNPRRFLPDPFAPALLATGGGIGLPAWKTPTTLPLLLGLLLWLSQHPSEVAGRPLIPSAPPWGTYPGKGPMPGYPQPWRREGVPPVLQGGEGFLLNPEAPKPLLPRKEEG